MEGEKGKGGKLGLKGSYLYGRGEKKEGRGQGILLQGLKGTPLQLDLCRSRSSPVVTLLDHLHLPHYKLPTALLDVHHITRGISSLLHSVNIIMFTLLLIHLILCASPHHSPLIRSHHLSLPRLLCRLKTHLFHKSFPL